MTIEDFEPSSSNPSGIYGQTCNMLIFRPNTRATGSVCEQVVQSSFPKPHELDSIRLGSALEGRGGSRKATG